MRFTKMNGAGNDFIIINNMEEKIPVEKLNQVAATLCQRRQSLGADGFMAVDQPDLGGDFKMRFYNSDGSEGEMCGNGARCIARYGYEKKLAGEVQKIETKSGMVMGWRRDSRQYKIRLSNPTVMQGSRTLMVDSTAWRCAYVELGNPGLPHLVVEIKDLQSMDKQELWKLGSGLRNHPDLPKGANVNFYEKLGEDELCEITFERGVEDFTLACGTGTASVVSILTLQGQVSGDNVAVRVPGGTLYVTVVAEGEDVRELYLTGPTNMVAEGEILDEELVD